VLVVGFLLVVAQVVGGGAFLVGLGDPDSLDASGLSTTLLVGGLLVSVLATVIGTAVCWATITLATAVAGYIAQRSPESLG
jgi:membrane protein implicated in regulation of membrane protease activity